MKRYMMSDIHGFLEAFEAALKKTDLSGENQLILLVSPRTWMNAPLPLNNTRKGMSHDP